MNIVIFGLSISSAWGNGHATLLRGLFRALHQRGHRIEFFEQDVPYYASHRDAVSFPFATLHLYSDWDQNLPQARSVLDDADVGIVTSYCPDGIAASQLVLDSHLPRTIFYDMDTPITLSRLEKGEAVPYLPPNGLDGFDLVLSYTGGQALDRLRTLLGARRVAALYGWVDPEMYFPADAYADFSADLSYLGTYSEDRQPALEEMLIRPARLLADERFVIAGAMYPQVATWPSNIRYFEHVRPGQHRAFYSSSPLTLSITRASMAAMGYCPSGRLFEAAACGTVVLSDWWAGLDTFFEPEQEILIGTSSSETIQAMRIDQDRLAELGARARQRALDCHTAEMRAQRLLGLIENPSDEAGQPELRTTLQKS